MKPESNRRAFLKTIGLGALALAGRRAIAAIPEKPNIVIILVDDLGWTDLACFGSNYYETPNIDKLCREGMKFPNGYAACAVCSPTRAAILTGRYPARTGITDWIHFANDDAAYAEGKNPTEYVGGPNNAVLCPPNPMWMEHSEVTLAEMLKPLGYATGHVGKWHLGGKPHWPETQGFDVNKGGCEYGQPPSYFDPYHRNAERPNIPTLPSRDPGEYLTDREADEATKFIRDHYNQPFYLNMDHYCVHTPIQGRPDLVAKYKDKPTTNQKNPEYAAMVESVDEAVGQLMATLRELDLDEKTIVLFTSDNGGLLGPTNNEPLRKGKGYPYEGGIRVPVIFRWPGVIAPGSVCETPVISVDYAPTFCELTGASLPRDRVIDGVSLVPLLKQTGGIDRQTLYWHFPHYRSKEIPPYSIIRDGDWKLIVQYEGKQYQLFNVKEDLSETKDLAEAMPEKVQALKAKLDQFLKESGAKMPKPNPDYKKG